MCVCVNLDELVIDYVESAFDKQVKQKTIWGNQPTSGSASSSLVLVASGSGVASHQHSPSPMVRIPVTAAAVTSKPPSEENATSVRERIMLFSAGAPRTFAQCEKAVNASPKKLKLPNKIHNELLFSNKFVQNQSSPSMSQPYLKKATTNASNSFVTLNSGHCNLKELRKYSSTTALVHTDEAIEINVVKSRTADELEQRGKPDVSEPNEHDHDEFEHFKSVKDKIAYFSSKAAAKRAASRKGSTNLNKAKSNSVLTTTSCDANPFGVTGGTNLKSNVPNGERFPFANKIEIVTHSSPTRKYNCQAEDYDSLKHAYKLNALANSTSNFHFIVKFKNE